MKQEGMKETSKKVDAAIILAAGGKCKQSTMPIMNEMSEWNTLFCILTWKIFFKMCVEDIFRMTSFKWDI